MKYLISILLLITSSAYAITFNSTGSGIIYNSTGTLCSADVPQACADDYYTAPANESFAGVGDQEDRNNLRGIFWTGPTITTCSGSIYLSIDGDISGITYEVSVWSVDPANYLELDTKIGSVTFSGSTLSNNAWNDYTFSTPLLLTTGTTALLLSRTDYSVEDGTNHIHIGQGYDSSDLDANQWNLHYYSTGIMAGRGSGDEDQPEPFTCTWNVDAYETSVAANTEYPNIPEDVTTSEASSTSILIDWYERGVNNVTIDYYNVYSYNTSTAVLTLIDTVSSPTTQYTNTGLSPGTYTYQVTAVSTSAKESAPSLKNGTGWQTTLN